ncbi:MAG: hypothetical protein LBC59_00605 [Chitinispirillales bacterium]|jgi:uncharacterized protein (TIGR02145 family)|nr:hypothetical protein [Chitinispirillales bacterium]
MRGFIGVGRSLAVAAAVLLMVGLLGCGSGGGGNPAVDDGGNNNSGGNNYYSGTIAGELSGDILTYVGQSYRTVVIRDKRWMAENLNYLTDSSWCFGEGGEVRLDRDSSVTLTESQIQENCNTYGRLYSWSAAKTACPSGWHLPSRDEWDDLARPGMYLKSNSGWDDWCGDDGNDSCVSGNGVDNLGFSALPGGLRSSWVFEFEGTVYGRGTDYVYAGHLGLWWAVRDDGGSEAMDMSNQYDFLYESPLRTDNIDVSINVSIRCVMN